MYDDGASKRNADSFVHERCTGHDSWKLHLLPRRNGSSSDGSIETNMVHEAGRKNVCVRWACSWGGGKGGKGSFREGNDLSGNGSA